MPRKWTVWAAATPTLVFGGTTWFSAAVPPPPPHLCVPHPPPLAPYAVPRLRRWRPRRTAATVMIQGSGEALQIIVYPHTWTRFWIYNQSQVLKDTLWAGFQETYQSYYPYHNTLQHSQNTAPTYNEWCFLYSTNYIPLSLCAPRLLALPLPPPCLNTLFQWCALRAWTSQSLLCWGLAGPTPWPLGERHLTWSIVQST